MKIIFATHNKHKLKEIQQILCNKFELVSLGEINCTEDIPETQPTIEGNASQKAFYIWNKYQLNCFADDTGLEVDALNGEPGVYSARYAGEDKNSKANTQKLLKNLEGQSNRKARFKTVISLVINGEETLFEGLVYGDITETERGNQGFGYDPVFLPQGYNKTYAEMELSEKNAFSHRALAVNKLVNYLKNL